MHLARDCVALETALMDKEDLASIRELAGELEDTDAHSAYKLYRLLVKLDANDPHAVAREQFLRSNLFGFMFTSRNDGTTQRLNAILVGYLLAQKMDIPFRFSWAKDVGALSNELSSVTNEVPDFFSREFCEQHFVEFESLKRYRMPSMKVPACEYVTGKRLRELLPAPKAKRVLNRCLNFCPPLALAQHQLQDWDAERRALIELMFSEPYAKALSGFRSDCEAYLGIHYRGGDVIYGRHRHGGHAISDKAAPLPVVEDLVQRFSDQKILLFGTPVGETLTDLRYLDNKYANVQLSLKLTDPQLDGVVQDAMMMASCRTLIAYHGIDEASHRGTGVAKLANIFNPALEKLSFDRLYSPDEFYQLCYDNIGNTQFNPRQRSYLNIRALALCDELDVSEDVQKQLIENIHALDPENKLDWLRKRKKQALAHG